MTLTELYNQRGRLVTQARAALDEINANTDDARAAELEARHDTIMGELDALDRKIDREQRQAEREAEQETRERETRNRRRPNMDGQGDGGGNDDEAPATYRDAFLAYCRAGGEISELSSEHRSILRQGAAEMRTQTGASAGGGGYTVPVELFNEIVRSMKDWGPMLDGNVARVLNTASGNQVNIPTVDDTAKGAGLHTEGTQSTDDGSEDITFAQKRLDAYLYDTEWLKVSYELMQDSQIVTEAFMGDLLGERLGRKGNAVLTTGSGSSQPNGIVTASTLGKTAASATAITHDEVMELFHSVNAAYRRSPKARWAFADTTLLALKKLKDGQGNYLWMMGDVRVGAPDTLHGKPYSINDDMATIATGNKTIIFGDFSRYWVRIIGRPVVGVVRERFYPDLGFLGLLRLDGELVDTAAVKHLIQA